MKDQIERIEHPYSGWTATIYPVDGAWAVSLTPPGFEPSTNDLYAGRGRDREQAIQLAKKVLKIWPR